MPRAPRTRRSAGARGPRCAAWPAGQRVGRRRRRRAAASDRLRFCAIRASLLLRAGHRQLDVSAGTAEKLTVSRAESRSTRRARLRAAPARRRCARSDSSRPSRARLSKIPAETVLPGDRDADRLEHRARLRPRAPRRRRAAPASIVRLVERLDAPRAPSRARASAVPRAVLAHHLVPRRLVDLDRPEREPDQVAGTRPGSRSSPAPPRPPARAAGRPRPAAPARARYVAQRARRAPPASSSRM